MGTHKSVKFIRRPTSVGTVPHSCSEVRYLRSPHRRPLSAAPAHTGPPRGVVGRAVLLPASEGRAAYNSVQPAGFWMHLWKASFSSSVSQEWCPS